MSKCSYTVRWNFILIAVDGNLDTLMLKIDWVIVTDRQQSHRLYFVRAVIIRYWPKNTYFKINVNRNERGEGSFNKSYESVWCLRRWDILFMGCCYGSISLFMDLSAVYSCWALAILYTHTTKRVNHKHT